MSILCTVATTAGAKSEPLTADQFAEHCDKLGAADLPGGRISQQGEASGWYFLQQELQHVGTGEFWKKQWADVSVAKTDPRPVIEAYAKALKAIGVDLVLVPVPPKSAIYPDKLTSKTKMEGTAPASDAVHPIADFYKPLTDAGVEVIDLEPIFRAERRKGTRKLYCEQDSHPSPYGCQLIAQHVHEALKGKPWMAGLKKPGFEFAVADPKTESFNGDLTTTGFKTPPVPPEKVTVSYAGKPDGKGGVEKVELDHADCPVILLGDSHTRIFSEGAEMLLRSAGVRDHLQALLGSGVANFGNNGSGVDTARIRLYSTSARDSKFWEGKKAVVWCIGARTFTRERKWREVPVKKK